jgi:hypothetical protein
MGDALLQSIEANSYGKGGDRRWLWRRRRRWTPTSVGEAKLKLKSSRVKDGELCRVEVKLREGLSWVGRGCGDLPMVDKGLVGEEL